MWNIPFWFLVILHTISKIPDFKGMFLFFSGKGFFIYSFKSLKFAANTLFSFFC